MTGNYLYLIEISLFKDFKNIRNFKYLLNDNIYSFFFFFLFFFKKKIVLPQPCA